MLPVNLRDRPVVFAAPLAGVSDIAYRSIAKRMGADYTFPEMIASEGLIRDNARTMDMMRRYEGEDSVGCQLFGTRPEAVAHAAQVVEQQGFNSADLNCGCPVHKVVDKNGGAALLKTPALLGKIIEESVKRISIPFSIKIRSGWDKNSLNYTEIGKIAEQSGAAYICLHARTQSEYFAPEAHWEHIAELKATVKIPVIGNGNIWKAEDAMRMLKETGCDGVMIASGSLGNPFIFREIRSLIETGEAAAPATNQERVLVCLEHVKMMVEVFGELPGIRRARKLLGWYYQYITGRKRIDQQLFQVDTYAEVERYLIDALEKLQEKAA